MQNNNIHFNASAWRVLAITRKKTPVTYDYKLGTDSRVGSKRILTSSLSPNFISILSFPSQKMLSELKQTCIRLTYTTDRRSHYLTHVKSRLCYPWEAQSYVYNVQLLKTLKEYNVGEEMDHDEQKGRAELQRKSVFLGLFAVKRTRG